MKKIIFTFGSLLLSVATYAQQQQVFTHYMYNTLAINPAYAGSRDALSATAIGRFQWVGFTGAPNTQNLTIHAPIASKNLGVGLSVMNQKIGPTNTTGVYGSIAYRMKLTENARLCFGVNGGFNSFSASLNELNLENQNDASFAQNLRGKMLPNVGAGIYFQSTRFYAGLSSPTLLQNKFFGSDTSLYANAAGQRRHYYFITGAVFNLTPQLKFKPTVLVKAAEKSAWQMDVTALLLINDVFSIGPNYRVGDGFGILVGVNISPQFTLSYSFDWSTGVRTGYTNSGSHEIMLRYDCLFHNEGKIKSPRYF